MTLYLLTAQNFRIAQQFAVGKRNQTFADFLPENEIGYFIGKNRQLVKYMGFYASEVIDKLENHCEQYNLQTVIRLIESRLNSNPNLKIYFN